jgi:two-component sensor histidine kinase
MEHARAEFAIRRRAGFGDDCRIRSRQALVAARDHSSLSIDRSSAPPSPLRKPSPMLWSMKGTRMNPETDVKAALRGLVALAWRQPLWAIPFAIFFGTQFGATPHAYWLCYEMSLTFAYLVGIAVWAARHIALRRIYGCPPDDRPSTVLRVGLTYIVAALIGSYAAAAVVHFTLYPGFLGSTQAVLVSGMYSLLFAALFSGISFAIRFYHQMVERARALETTRAELAEAELRALRAQIQPHFLFNTLNSIAALIHEDPAAAEETTTRLAEVFRHALRASDHEHTRFADELAFVRGYLEIERTRLGARLQLEERIEPGLESARVPSLLLQPVVENAVRYGVAPRAEGGTVRLSARREGASMVIEVQDDGPGFPAHANLGDGFGLRSVRERLEIAGAPHALDIVTAPGAGTLIRITLPYHEHVPHPRTSARSRPSPAPSPPSSGEPS